MCDDAFVKLLGTQLLCLHLIYWVSETVVPRIHEDNHSESVFEDLVATLRKFRDGNAHPRGLKGDTSKERNLPNESTITDSELFVEQNIMIPYGSLLSSDPEGLAAPCERNLGLIRSVPRVRLCPQEGPRGQSSTRAERPWLKHHIL